MRSHANQSLKGRLVVARRFNGVKRIRKAFFLGAAGQRATKRSAKVFSLLSKKLAVVRLTKL